MSLKEESREPAPKRRRGAALEAALLDAAWEELTERGYEGFTIDAVAERARTSRAVVYRRWPGKAELVRAAAVRAGARQPTPVPDTGTLRGDVIELLRQANASRAGIGVQMILQLGGYFADTGTGLAELRGAFLSEHGSAMRQVLDRAVARGRGRPREAHPPRRRRAVRPLPAGAADDAEGGARRGGRGHRRRGVPAAGPHATRGPGLTAVSARGTPPRATSCRRRRRSWRRSPADGPPRAGARHTPAPPQPWRAGRRRRGR